MKVLSFAARNATRAEFAPMLVLLLLYCASGDARYRAWVQLQLRKAAFDVSENLRDEKTLAGRFERAVVVTAGDFRLFLSLCVARVIVWNTTRLRERRLASERLTPRDEK